jgi:hypothetical protein
LPLGHVSEPTGEQRMGNRRAAITTISERRLASPGGAKPSADRRIFRQDSRARVNRRTVSQSLRGSVTGSGWNPQASQAVVSRSDWCPLSGELAGSDRCHIWLSGGPEREDPSRVTEVQGAWSYQRVLSECRATVTPAAQPGALPPPGGCPAAVTSPMRVRSQETTELQVHIPPA